jgi:transcriptional regulator with XRE-family HTH domain
MTERSDSRIRRIRLGQGKSQSELAQLAGISKRTLERIEANRDGQITLWHLVNLALVLECDLYDLIEDEWLRFRQIDRTVTAPTRTQINRPLGSRHAEPGRERAPRRRSS